MKTVCLIIICSLFALPLWAQQSDYSVMHIYKPFFVNEFHLSQAGAEETDIIPRNREDYFLRGKVRSVSSSSKAYGLTVKRSLVFNSDGWLYFKNRDSDFDQAPNREHEIARSIAYDWGNRDPIDGQLYSITTTKTVKPDARSRAVEVSETISIIYKTINDAGAYDSDGDLLEMLIDRDNGSEIIQRITDKQGRLRRVRTFRPMASSPGYSSMQLRRMNATSGIRGYYRESISSYRYDDAMRITEISTSYYKRDGSGDGYESSTYSYQAFSNGNLKVTAEARDRRGRESEEVTVYNDRGLPLSKTRVTESYNGSKSSESYTFSYEYDAKGNWLVENTLNGDGALMATRRRQITYH